ncbi:MAG: GNAT family N-acetyltransferase [Bryobacteraceae bacterium]
MKRLTAAMHPKVLADRSLAQRLERAEAGANASFVEARAVLMPDSGATWISVAGAYAFFDGPNSPCTQTFGLGLFEMPSAADMGTIEEFFRSRGAPVFHEVSPLADKALLELLHSRSYRPVELTSVMYLPLVADVPALPASEGPIRVRLAGKEESDLWARTAVEGWSETTEFADGMFDLMRAATARQDPLSFLAEMEGRPVATGALCLHERVALLAGASTVPASRRRGAQQALLHSRLEYATHAGCDLAMMCAEPGSASQRNAERHGFRIAYTRIKWGS